MTTTAMAIAIAVCGPRPAPAQVGAECYAVETIPTPPGISPEASAIAFTRRGDLVVAFRLGSIWIRDRDTLHWRRFAQGLLWPLGILPGDEGELFVTQMPELTRIADTDGDGEADAYDTICDAWGLSGNYHEFIAGPVRDRNGDFWVALGCCSSGGPIREPVRGAFTEASRKTKQYGHYSPVRYRGWVLKISPSGDVTPISCGLRQPNGLGFDERGELFVVDNQGDWVGTSPLHHVSKGAFHGHPPSLVWDPTFHGDPATATPAELAPRRKMPAIQFPQNDLAGSTAQPLCDTTGGRFGPYAGQFFVAEWTYDRILRASLEEVDGVWQGACFLFVEGRGLRRGNNRLAFAPDGSLWIAQVSRLWGGRGEGLQRIRFTGRTPMDIVAMRLKRDGFEIELTKPIDALSAASTSAYSMTRYRYLYHAKYGSPKTDVEPVAVTAATVSPDGRRVRLVVDGLIADRVYDLRPRGLKSRDGEPLVTRIAAYTVNRLRK